MLLHITDNLCCSSGFVVAVTTHPKQRFSPYFCNNASSASCIEHFSVTLVALVHCWKFLSHEDVWADSTWSDVWQNLLSSAERRNLVEEVMQHRKDGFRLDMSVLVVYSTHQQKDLCLWIFHWGLRTEAQECKYSVTLLWLEEVFIVPTISILIEDLGRQWVAFLWLFISGDVLIHPKPLFLQHGDVYLLEVDSIGLQEAHHRLLMLFYRDRASGGGDVYPDDHFIPNECPAAAKLTVWL